MQHDNLAFVVGNATHKVQTSAPLPWCAPMPSQVLGRPGILHADYLDPSRRQLLGQRAQHETHCYSASNAPGEPASSALLLQTHRRGAAAGGREERTRRRRL